MAHSTEYRTVPIAPCATLLDLAVERDNTHMPSITLSKTEEQSKGRNGWFCPTKAQVLYGPHDTITVEIWSKTQSGEPPIDLYLTPQDATLLGKALVSMSVDDIVSTRRIALVYQAGIANVFDISKSGQPKRLMQNAFGPCEWYAQGLRDNGANLEVYSCNQAGDIAMSYWHRGMEQCPFRDSAHPPKESSR